MRACGMGDAMSQARRPQFFACDQAFQNLRIGKAMALRKQGREPFEQLPFVRDAEIQMNVVNA